METRNAYRNLAGEPEGRRPLGRFRCARIAGKLALKMFISFVHDVG
jgi:hypothetical protein